MPFLADSLARVKPSATIAVTQKARDLKLGGAPGSPGIPGSAVPGVDPGEKDLPLELDPNLDPEPEPEPDHHPDHFQQTGP